MTHPSRLPIIFVLAMLLFAIPQLVLADESQTACLIADGETLSANTLSQASEGQFRPLSAAYFVDPTGTIDVDSIAAQTFTANACKQSFPVPAADGALWLRFDVTNPQTDTQRRLIGIIELFVHELTLYEERADGLVLLSRNGRSVPSAEKPINVVRPAVPIQIGPGTTTTLYLRISGMLAPNATPIIVSPDRFASWSTTSGVNIALMAGFALVMILCSLIFFRQVDPRSYQYYAAYMTTRLFFAVFYNDWFAQVSGIILSPAVNTRLIQLFVGIGTLLLILFCRVLLSPGGHSRRHNQVFQALLLVGAAVVCVTVLSPFLLRIPLFVFNVVTPLVLLVLAVAKHRDGLPHARWICAGLASLMLGMLAGVIGFMIPSEIMPTSSALALLFMNPLKLGYLFAIYSEPIFMMMAIAVMVNSMRAQQQAALAETAALRHDAARVKSKFLETQKATSRRIEDLEAILLDDPKLNLLAPAEKRFAERAISCVLDHVSVDDFGARGLASAMGQSEKTLGRRLRQTHGLTPAAFIRSVRLDHARELILLRQFTTVAEVARASGFSSTSYFTKLYRQQFDQTPREAFEALKTEQDMPREP